MIINECLDFGFRDYKKEIFGQMTKKCQLICSYYFDIPLRHHTNHKS